MYIRTQRALAVGVSVLKIKDTLFLYLIFLNFFNTLIYNKTKNKIKVFNNKILKNISYI